MAKQKGKEKIIRTGTGESLILEYGKLNALEERINALESRIESLEKASRPNSGKGSRRPRADKREIPEGRSRQKKGKARTSQRK
jgi:hypothetical protein